MNITFKETVNNKKSISKFLQIITLPNEKQNHFTKQLHCEQIWKSQEEALTLQQPG